jgi:alpha/beta superfamily hydrolase
LTEGNELRFRGADGHLLSARLDRPASTPRAYALFAHCFTCSKDSLAAVHVGRELAAQGIAALRFDFTGLGSSSGDFADTNFSSNVADLIAAADFLRERFTAPQLLIGHSLGGTAVLAAAERIPEVSAVATIGAPYQPDHVRRLLVPASAEIEARGEAEVLLAGRKFRIKRQLLEDLAAHHTRESISKLGKALLVFHSPVDLIVDITNAGQIFGVAKHPKSFVSLAEADHLLTRASDCSFVAAVLASWVNRYVIRSIPYQSA